MRLLNFEDYKKTLWNILWSFVSSFNSPGAMQATLIAHRIHGGPKWLAISPKMWSVSDKHWQKSAIRLSTLTYLDLLEKLQKVALQEEKLKSKQHQCTSRTSGLTDTRTLWEQRYSTKQQFLIRSWRTKQTNSKKTRRQKKPAAPAHQQEENIPSFSRSKKYTKTNCNNKESFLHCSHQLLRRL